METTCPSPRVGLSAIQHGELIERQLRQAGVGSLAQRLGRTLVIALAIIVVSGIHRPKEEAGDRTGGDYDQQLPPEESFAGSPGLRIPIRSRSRAIAGPTFGRSVSRTVVCRRTLAGFIGVPWACRWPSAATPRGYPFDPIAVQAHGDAFQVATEGRGSEHCFQRGSVSANGGAHTVAAPAHRVLS